MSLKMMAQKNILPRAILLILAAFPLFHFNEFYRHFYAYITGGVITAIITQQWRIVVLSAAIFIAFLIPLSFRRKANWAEYGLVSAFFVSLFFEMYGIPLTVLFASKYFFANNAGLPFLPANVVEFNLFGVAFGMDLAMAYAAALMVLGAALITAGWITLYMNVRSQNDAKNSGKLGENEHMFVSTGIYSFSRHPQYFGFILIILGWLIGWPTILTLVLSPILIYKYVKVCRTEEKEICEKAPEYGKYMENVPFFV